MTCNTDSAGNAQTAPDSEDDPQIRFTRLRLKSPKTGGKHFDWDDDGVLTKETVGWVGKATAYFETAVDLEDFALYLTEDMKAGRDINAYGLPTMTVPEKGLLVLSDKKYRARKNRDNVITRTETFFAWPSGPAVILGDYDPRGGETPMTRDQLVEANCEASTKLAVHQMLWGVSSSSYIHDSETGEELKGLSGQRLYMIALDGRDIPRAMEAHQKRLWLAGHGYILISGSGNQLLRSLLDPCVYQPSRLDYAAGAVCAEGLQQERPEPVLVNPTCTKMIDTKRVFPPLTAAEQERYEDSVEQAKADTKEEADAQRERWIDARLRDEAIALLGDEATETEIAMKVAELVEAGRRDELARLAKGERTVLSVDSVVWITEDEFVTVGDILNDWDTYDGMSVCDPVEPEYDGYRKTAIIFARDRKIVSQAHGANTIYVLGTDAEFETVWDVQVQDACARWGDIVAALEAIANGDDKEAIKAALLRETTVDICIKLEGVPDAIERIESLARKTRVKTKLDTAVKQRRAALFHAEPRDDRQDDDRPSIEVGNPNDFPTQARELAKRAGERQMGFVFGKHAVVIQREKSAVFQVKQRDDEGNVVLDAKGEPVTKPSMVSAARILTKDDTLLMAGDLGYFHEIKAKGGKYVDEPSTVPSQLLRMIHASLKERLPAMKGVATHPVWYEGQMLTGDGVYHEPSGLWLATGDLDPYRFNDPDEAYRFLRHDWLGDFPFETETDAVKAISIGATMYTAPVCFVDEAGPPANLISAPHAGTGKTLLTCSMGAAVTGRPVGSSTYPADEIEREKVITAAIMEGVGMLMFDNLKSGTALGTSHTSLMKLVTDAIWKGRILVFAT